MQLPFATLRDTFEILRIPLSHYETLMERDSLSMLKGFLCSMYCCILVNLMGFFLPSNFLFSIFLLSPS